MAEELQDAAYRLPRVMLWATIINGGMMFVMAVTVTYCIGDLESGKCKAFMLLGNRVDVLLLMIHQYYRHRQATRTFRSSTMSRGLSLRPML